jgi:hypothetical protein
MSVFTPVGFASRLWQVTDLLTAEQTQEIINIDWLSLKTMQVPQQQSWAREQVLWDEPEIQSVCRYISSQLPVINQALGTAFAECNGNFWIDFPGFRCDMHTDGHLANSMQLYWIVPGPEYGTGFYNFKNADTLMYQFESRPNSGYLMLNHPNDNESQPLLWHAMLNPVPEGTIRVSSYWQFK